MLNVTDLRAEHFAPLKGEDFRLISPGGELAVTLATVKSMPCERRAGGGFTLHCLGPADPVLRQGTYKLAHAAIGVFDLFIVPKDPVDGQMVYEIAFN